MTNGFEISEATRERVARFHATGSAGVEFDNRRPSVVAMARGEFVDDASIRAETVERIEHRIDVFGESVEKATEFEHICEFVVIGVRKHFFGR